jgi:hypothetical protein
LLILPEYNRALFLETVNDPITIERYWTFSTKHLDFMLTPILYLEEYIGPAITLEIKGFKFDVPASWFILIADHETTYVDVIPIASLMGKEFDTFTFCTEDSKIRYYPITVSELVPEQKLIYPVLQKGQGLVNPFGKDELSDAIVNCVISPFDLFQKVSKTLTIDDLLFA